MSDNNNNGIKRVFKIGATTIQADAGKSKSHRDDIRQKLIELEARKARRYPTSDLIAARRTLAQVIGATA